MSLIVPAIVWSLCPLSLQEEEGQQRNGNVETWSDVSWVQVLAGGETALGHPLPSSPDADHLYLACADGQLRVFSWSDCAELRSHGTRSVLAVSSLALVKALAVADRFVADSAVDRLVDQRDHAKDALQRGLAHDDPEVRWRVLKVLGRFPIPDLRQHVRRCLQHADARVRRHALKAYAVLEPGDLYEVCSLALRRDPDVGVRHDAAVLIAQPGRLIAVDDLLDCVEAEDEQRGVHLAAFASLRRLTGLTLGRDETKWRAWWINHRDEILARRPTTDGD